LKTLMEQDDGGRGMDHVGLECGVASPAHAVSTLGSASFREPLPRNAAETHLSTDKRLDRKRRGLVPWSPEPQVPDVGGVGWRTKAGHLIKNQSFYPQVSTNKWDNPTFAGVNTWKEFHGPRKRADADMMEQLDRFDESRAELEAKKTFVNTMRVETLDKFYNRKLNRVQLSTSSSWAPHRKSRREVHSRYETFDGSMDEKPRKELRKVFTDKVLSSDREAIRQIAKRVQNEETWREVFKRMEQERRADLRADLQHRQAHVDRLMMLSGQHVKQHLPPGQPHSSLVNATARTEEIARHSSPRAAGDLCALSDFRGLVHADGEHALEALFPGAGHRLSTEFRARATASAQAGWPPPKPAETPRMATSAEARAARQSASLSKLSIPSSVPRMERLGARTGDELQKQHAQPQFLPTAAPPPPDQSATLLHEDWSATTTMQDCARVTGSFSRTSHLGSPVSQSSKLEMIPPPRRSYVYPMMAPTSPHTAPQASNGLGSTATLLLGSHSAPSLGLGRSAGRSCTNVSLGRARRSSAACGEASAAAAASVCRELDEFELHAESAAVPRISNFFGTPRPRAGAS